MASKRPNKVYSRIGSQQLVSTDIRVWSESFTPLNSLKTLQR